MEKLWEKIRKINYAAFFKLWLILGICAGLLGGGVSAVLLRPQLREAATAIEAGDRQMQETSAGREHAHDWEKFHVSEPSTAAKVALGLTAAAAALFAGAYWLAVAGWVSQKAYSAGMNGLLWGLLALFGNLAAAVLFFLARSVLRQRCVACGTWQPKGLFCRACGAKLELHCPGCGGKCAAGDRFCHGCGAALEH